MGIAINSASVIMVLPQRNITPSIGITAASIGRGAGGSLTKIKESQSRLVAAQECVARIGMRSLPASGAR
jgi:hypothetical protein